MYINGHIIGRSKDLLHWESAPLETRWPGREGCFALADYSNDPEDIVLFTGGHHSGHFYAIGEVRFSKRDPESPLTWLPRPVLRRALLPARELMYAIGSPGCQSGFKSSSG